MRVTYCGYGYRHSEHFYIDRPNGKRDECLFLVIRSRAWFCIDGERQEVGPDSVILFEKGSPQHYGALGGEYVNDWVHFEADENDRLLWGKLGIPTDRLIPLGTSGALSELIRGICDEMHGGSPYAGETASLIGTMLWYRLAEIRRLDQPREMQAHYERLKAIRNRIYLSPEREWRVDGLAREAAMSRSYFQHLYSRFFGASVSADILESRMTQAKNLLVSTSESVSAIAERCGYKSDVHFMRQFKRVVGMRSTEYRERGRGK